MPNSLNKIFQHFREKQKQRNLNKDTNNNQKKDLFHDEFTQINLINNLNNNKKGLGVSGCCSRKTSSSIPSGDQQTLKKNSWTGRKVKMNFLKENFLMFLLVSEIIWVFGNFSDQIWIEEKSRYRIN